MENTKDDVTRFLMAVKDGKLVPYTKKEVMAKTGCSYYTLKNEAIRMDLEFLDGRGEHLKLSNDHTEEILNLLRENPAITYKEIAKRVGLSRQRVYQIVKENGGKKSEQVLRSASKQRVDRMLKYYQINPPESSRTSALLRFKVDLRTYQRYVEIYGRTKDVQNFEKIHKRGVSKADQIRELLQTTDHSVTKIARQCGTSVSYVCQVRHHMQEKAEKER